MGRLALYEGKTIAARALLEESLALAREVGHKGLIAWVLQTLASVARYEADYETAQALLAESLTLARDSGEHEVVADVLNGFAALAAVQRQPERAAQLFGAAEVLHEAVNLSLPPVIRAEYSRNMSAARQQMNEPAFSAAWAEGRAMTLGQALERALENDLQVQAGQAGL